MLARAAGLAARLQAVYEPKAEGTPVDPDFALYNGGFLSDADRREIARLRRLSPEALAGAQPVFRDPRLPELWFRYRARNWPEGLSEAEREQWAHFRRQRLTDPAAGAPITAGAYRERIQALRIQHADDPSRLGLLEELSAWGDRLGID
jgi:exodeoxyribonuclease-1